MKKKSPVIIIVASILVLYIAAVVVIDPYNYFKTNIVSKDTKARIAFPLNERLSKIIEYKQNPSPNILIGDSRIQNLNPVNIEKISGKKYFNFGYGGCTLPEMISSFWFATKHQKLENVCIGISFDMYNHYNNTDYFKNALKSSNLFSYIFNVTNFPVMYYMAKDALSGEKVVLGVPKVTDMNSYWKQLMAEQTGKFYKSYKYPEDFKKELLKIRDYCRENNIGLAFFNPPTYIDLQNKIREFSLQNEYQVFLDDIRGMGTLYDFNYISDFTTDKANFFDPFHSRRDLDTLLVRTIFSEPDYFRRLYPPEGGNPAFPSEAGTENGKY